MADYFLNQTTGKDGGAGTAESTAWRTFHVAQRSMSASDTLNISGATVTNPIREVIQSNLQTDPYKYLFDTASTFTADSMQNVILSKNLTEGEKSHNIMAVSCDAWTDATTLYLWDLDVGSTDGKKETTIVPEGKAASCLIERIGAGGSTIRLDNMQGMKDTNFRLEIDYYDKTSSSQLRWKLKDVTASSVFYIATTPTTGTWGVETNNNAPNSEGAWSTLEITGETTTSGASVFEVHLNTVISGDVHGTYIGEVRLYLGSDTSGNNVWAQNLSATDGNVYEIEDMDTRMVFYCTKEEWTANGVDALQHLGVPDVTREPLVQGGLVTFDDALSTPDSWAWDTSTLRINLGTKSIDDMHIESWTANNSSTVSNSANCTLNNLRFAAHDKSINFKQTCVQSNMKFDLAWTNVQFTDTTAQNNSIVSTVEICNALKDGLVAAANTASDTAITLKEVNAHSCLDEGVQAIDGGEIDVEGGYGTTCGSTYFSGNSAFGAEGASDFTGNKAAIIRLKNVTASGNHASGIALTDSADQVNSSLENVVSYDNDTGGTGGFDINWASQAIVATFTDFGTQSASGALSDGVDDNKLLTSSPFDNAPNLAENANAVGTANKWWGTGPRPTGYGGEPFSDRATDKGGAQSTWSPFHPASL